MTAPLLEITAELSDALGWVLGDAPTAAEPVVVLAASLDKLAKGYGLSESGQIDWDPLERADLPAPAEMLLRHLFAEDAAGLRADSLRDRLSEAFVLLARDRDARRTLNRNNPLREEELLKLGQIYWNIEARGARAGLPLKSGQIAKGAGSGSKQVRADIRVPGSNKDFATLTWTQRVNEKGAYKSSGQGFRKQGARLAVLAARLLIGSSEQPLPDLQEPELTFAPVDQTTPRVLGVTWPAQEPVTPVLRAALGGGQPDGSPWRALPEASGGRLGPGFDAQRVLIGAPGEVGADYQPRGFDAELGRLWADGGDRRIWLRGGPGLGKSYSARRVVQEALAGQSSDREVLLVWVDSADAASVTDAYADAFDRLGQFGAGGHGGSKGPAADRARQLLGLLATSTWRWLVVLDNADAGSLIQSGLVPPGGNPNGRVLLTTLGRDPRIASHGRVVEAALFTAEEAEAYLRGDVHSRGNGNGTGPLSLASQTQTGALARTVGYHPLALSIAAATIAANAMEVSDWIEEFAATTVMDATADAPDRGGYPHLIGATWRIALGRACQGLPDGVVERAAMVAAVQDPDGHPAWLWDRPAVAGWVAAGPALDRRHGMPVALRRLIDHGIVELRGGTWKHGRVAIHQLAARAVRELPAPAVLAELAGILAREWLLQLTADPSAARPDVMRANLAPIAALPDLPAATAQTVTALSHYQRSSPVAQWVEGEEEDLDRLAPALESGGSIGRAHLASKLSKLGDDLDALGRREQARARHERATGLYRQIIEDPTLNDELRADYLKNLGELEMKLDQPDDARARWAEAAALYQRLLQRDPDRVDLDRLVALAGLYEDLGNPDRKTALLPLADKLLQRTVADDPDGPTDEWAQERRGSQWVKLGGIMRALGQTGRAKDCLALAVESYQRAAQDSVYSFSWFRRDEALRALVLLHCRTGDWDQALDCLTSIAARQSEAYGSVGGDDLVLLASVQQHLGRSGEAATSLATAAGRHPGPTPDLPRRFSRPDYEVIMGLVVTAQNHERWPDAVALSEAMLDRSYQYEDGSTEESATDIADAHFWAASSYELFGSSEYGLGRHDAAAAHYERAVGLLRLLADRDPTDRGAQRSLAASLSICAGIYAQIGRHEDAAVNLERAVRILGVLADLDPTDRGTQNHLGIALRQRGAVCLELGQHEDARAHLERAVSAYQILVDLDPADREGQQRLAESLSDLGRAHFVLGQFEDASARFEQAVGICEALADTGGTDRAARQLLAQALESSGLARVQLGRHEEGTADLERAVSIGRALADEEPGDHLAEAIYARALNGLGIALAVADRLEEAADCVNRSANTLELLVGLDPDAHAAFLVAVLRWHAEVLGRLGRAEDAEKATARADELAERYPDPGTQG